MSEEEAFLRAIIEEPDEGSHRLVYADWLEERGDPRGEYLRCQCSRSALRPADPTFAALLRREKDLLRQHPAVIGPWQQRLTLGRIQGLLGRTEGGGGRAERVDETVSQYTPNSCLTESDLRAWEASYRVALPEEYRLFLREVGNGGVQAGSYTDFIVEPLANVRGEMSAARPFPVTDGRLRSRLLQLEAEGQPANGVLFPELTAYWRGADQPGCLVFGQYPSSDALFLVTAGELRGSVWCCVSSGTPELDKIGEPVGFLAWFADVLAEFKNGA
jgi:uncharacterized protein (TIGR02996 family)